MQGEDSCSLSIAVSLANRKFSDSGGQIKEVQTQTIQRR